MNQYICKKSQLNRVGAPFINRILNRQVQFFSTKAATRIITIDWLVMHFDRNKSMLYNKIKKSWRVW